MVLSTAGPRRHPWGHMEVPLAALEEDFLWLPAWRCTAFVTNPVAEGRNGIPPGRAQWPLPGKLIPTLPRAQALAPHMCKESECVSDLWVFFSTFGGVAFWLKHIILSQRGTPMNPPFTWSLVFSCGAA